MSMSSSASKRWQTAKAGLWTLISGACSCWPAIRVGFWTLVSGASIGFLIGMSVTPVIQGVITAVLTLAVAVVTAVVGLKEAPAHGPTRSEETKSDGQNGGAIAPSKANLFVAPLGCLLLGIALGSCLGIMSRSHFWLGQSPQSFAKTWQKTGL